MRAVQLGDWFRKEMEFVAKQRAEQEAKRAHAIRIAERLRDLADLFERYSAKRKNRNHQDRH